MSRQMIHAVIIVTLVVVTFGSSLGNRFVWDDLPVIVDNPLVSGTRGVAALLTAEDTIPGLGATGYYRPLTYLSFYFDQLLWGGRPAGFHATNLVLHAGVALALYRLLFAVTCGTAVSLLATLLFALNPVTVEAVCFAAGGRNTLLCALFALLALLMHRRGSTGRAALCVLAAAASKEAGFLLPPVLLAHDIILAGGRRSWRGYALLTLPLAALLGVRAAVVGAEVLVSGATTGMLLAPELVLRYLAVIVIPSLHRVAYLLMPPQVLSLRFAGALAGCAVLAILCLLSGRNRLVPFGWVWFLLFLLPALAVAGRYKLAMADRHAYLPAVGIAMLLAGLLTPAAGRIRLLAGACLAALFAGLTFVAVPVWQDNGTLFSRMVRDEPRAETGYTELASHLARSGDLPGAEGVVARGEAAGALSPPLARFVRLGMYSRGAERLLAEGRLDEAAVLVNRALGLEPEFVPALIDAGAIAARRGDLQGAIRLFTRAAALQPGDPTPHYNLAEVYRMFGDGAGAEREMAEYWRRQKKAGN